MKEDVGNNPVTKDKTPLVPKIAHHGAYVDETKQLLRAYADCESYTELERQVLEDNVLNKNTDEYRRNVLREVMRRYVPETDEFARTPLIHLLDADVAESVENWCLYYEFSSDPFVSTLTREYLYPEFERGSLTVRTSDIVTYIESIADRHPELASKSETTIEEAARGYLAALKNFGLLEGVQQKEFTVTHVPDEAVAYVVYRLAGRGVTTAEGVIEHADWRLFLLDETEVRRRLRGISPTYVRYERRGSTERLELTFDDTMEVIDEF